MHSFESFRKDSFWILWFLNKGQQLIVLSLTFLFLIKAVFHLPDGDCFFFHVQTLLFLINKVFPYGKDLHFHSFPLTIWPSQFFNFLDLFEISTPRNSSQHFRKIKELIQPNVSRQILQNLGELSQNLSIIQLNIISFECHCDEKGIESTRKRPLDLFYLL